MGLACAFEGAEGCMMLRMLRTLKRQRRIETHERFPEEVDVIGP